VRPGQTIAFPASVVLLLLAGCSGVPSTAPAAQSNLAATGQTRFNANLQSQRGVPNVMLPAIERAVHPAPVRVQQGAHALSHGVIYTAQYYGNDAKIYSLHNTKLKYMETITAGLSNPQGTATTAATITLSALKGLWYIANTGASNVPVYESSATGPTGPIETLGDPGQFPVDVDASDQQSLVAVSNAFSTSFGSGSVSLYANGSQSPTGTLGVNAFVEGVGVTIDGHGNCYWSYNDLRAGVGEIVRFTECSGRGRVIVSGLGFAGGVAIDKADNLYYTDQRVGLYKCAGSAYCALLSSGFGDPMFINFDKAWNDLWLADASGFIDSVDPMTGAIDSSTPAVAGTSDPPFGVAAAPASRY
jgi:hypothetical protein